MDEAFEVPNLQHGLNFLSDFPAEARLRGAAYYREGRVESLEAEEPGRSYVAQVRDKAVYEVRLDYHEDIGWEGFCKCPVGGMCAHVFAALSAVLAEHRTQVVRNLSSTRPRTPLRWAKPARPAPAPGGTSELAGRLTAATGRRLTAREEEFLRTLHEVYTGCRQSRTLTYWDLQRLGLPLTLTLWAPAELWPAFPESEYEFWLYLAHALRAQNAPVPAFMLPITDLSVIEPALARWRRTQEINRWKQVLEQHQSEAGVPRRQSVGETDLRLVIDELGCWAERRRPGQTAFEPLKQMALRQLGREVYQGEIQFTPEAEWLWPFCEAHLNYQNKLHWKEFNENEEQALGRLLRVRVLESRIVNPAGQPLARPAETMRWSLTPAADDQDDYRLRLVRADGSPAPTPLAAFCGNPPLCLTADAVYTGPEALAEVLDPAKENRIPAPALEQPSGIAFLQSLGVELPPSLRERIRLLPFQVVIQCELRAVPTCGMKPAEDCVFRVVAEAPDGYQETWTGSSWKAPHPPRRRRKGDPLLTVYDRAALEAVPPLLALLPLKSGSYAGRLAMRVTKKFPELFTAFLQSVPPHVRVDLAGELASLVDGEVAGRVKLEVTEAEIDWFDLRVVLNVEDTTLTPEEIKLLLNAKGGYVRLAGKGWRRLRYDLSEEENDQLANLGLSPRGLSAEPQRLHALQLAHEAARKFLPAQQVDQVQRRAGELKARVTPALPDGVRADLRPYQLEGFHFLAYLTTNHFGGVLADDMGLGKTLQTLAWLLWLRQSSSSGGLLHGTLARENNDLLSPCPGPALPPPAPPATGPAPSLVVCPKSVMDNWQAEAARFTPGLRVRAWAAGDLDRLERELDSADLHVINYSQLRLFEERVVAIRWQAVILDEGQYIKNPGSQTAQVARALRAEQRLVLSGTPIENRLLDLWSLMAFAMPGVLGNRAQFARLYDAKDDPFARRRLASRVRPFLLRRTKGQVAKDLPDRIEEDLFCEIEGEQQALYRAELKRAQQLLLGVHTQKEFAQQQFHFLTSLLRLRQICCHPRLIVPDSSAPSAKTEALLEQLEPLMEEGQKVLVFSQFVEMLQLLKPALEKRGWPLFYLAGDTENRGELVREFHESAGPAVFLISLKAGGFGLNLAAASYVVLFDPWWNPAVENQAIDRTHRIGQVNKVIAYRLLIKNSIEEKIRELQRQKKALAEDVLGEEKFSQSLTLADLQYLLAD